ncbi:hypothetical protein HOG98_02990 [bacterium]|nr:hypothetical protein [bacterium]
MIFSDSPYLILDFFQLLFWLVMCLFMKYSGYGSRLIKKVQEQPLYGLLFVFLFLSIGSFFSILPDFFNGFDFRFFPLDFIDGRLHISSYLQMACFIFIGLNLQEFNKESSVFDLFSSKRFFYFALSIVFTFYSLSFYLQYKYDLIQYSVLSKYLSFFWNFSSIQDAGLKQLVSDGPWVPVLWPLFKVVSFMKNPLFFYFISLFLFVSSFLILYWVFLKFVFKRTDYSFLAVLSLLFLPATQRAVFYGFHPSMICFLWLVMAIAFFFSSYRIVSFLFLLMAMLTWSESVFFALFLMGIIFLCRLINRLAFDKWSVRIREKQFLSYFLLDVLFLVILGCTSIFLFSLKNDRVSFFLEPVAWTHRFFNSFLPQISHFLERFPFIINKLFHHQLFSILLGTICFLFIAFVFRSKLSHEKILIFFVSLFILLGVSYGPFYTGQFIYDKYRSDDVSDIFNFLNYNTSLVAPTYFLVKYPFYSSSLSLDVFERKGISFSDSLAKKLSYHYEFMMVPLDEGMNTDTHIFLEKSFVWETYSTYSYHILYRSKNYQLSNFDEEGR